MLVVLGPELHILVPVSDLPLTVGKTPSLVYVPRPTTAAVCIRETTMMLTSLKILAQRLAHSLGYRIERLSPHTEVPIEVLDLLIYKLAGTVPDFFFVQVGANDGITHDPIRKYVTRYHWRGILIEPQPQVFEQLRANYRDEPQLHFENAVISEKDGAARFFIADPNLDPTRNLTVFSSLNKHVLARCLPRAAGHRSTGVMQEVQVPAISVPSLIARHQLVRIDLLQTDTQGYDCAIVQQFLGSPCLPTLINFEHCHASSDELQRCYRRLVDYGYRLAKFEHDTVAYREKPM